MLYPYSCWRDTTIATTTNNNNDKETYLANFVNLP